MQNFLKMRIFRIFSANDWNNLESSCSASQTVAPQPKTAPILSLNAEKLRKSESRKIKEN